MIVTPSSSRRFAYAALAGAGTLWGASFLFGKLALAEMGAATLVFYRFVLAAAALLPLVPWRRTAWARTDTLLALVGACMAGPLVFLLQFEGLDRTTASSAALLVATAPPMMALGGAWLDRERPGRWAWVAVGLSALGVVLLVGTPSRGRTLVGDAMVFASMVSAVSWTLLARRLARRVGVLAATAVQFGLGALVLLPFMLALDGVPAPAYSAPAYSALGWTSVFVLGLGCTAVTFFLWNWALLRVEAARAGVIGNLEPLVGSVLGVVFLNESLGPYALAGAVCLLSAAVLATVSDAPSAEVAA